MQVSVPVADHRGRHSRRLSYLSRQQLGDATLPPALAQASSANPPPSFLRGTVLREFALKASLFSLIYDAMEGPSGIRERYGFQGGISGGARVAMEVLLADLVGGGGSPADTSDAAIAALHEAYFENYNNWALTVGARCVFSERLVSADSRLSVDSLQGPRVAAARAAAGLPAAPPPPLPATGAAPRERLVDLVLAYAIRTEAANLRFMPELSAWLFHQMRFDFLPPPTATEVAAILPQYSSADAAATATAAPETSFFAISTVAPLYAILKSGAARRVPVPPACGGICSSRHTTRERPSSERANYDDLNEFFWTERCLSVSPHTACPPRLLLTAALGGPSAPKTFREVASWAAILLLFFRWFSVQAVAFHAVFSIAWAIVAKGGLNLTGLILVDPLDIILAASEAAQTAGWCHLLLLVMAAAHSAPPRAFGPALARTLYGLLWSGTLIVASNAQALFNINIFRGPVWLAIVGARFLFFIIAEGAFGPCGCGRGMAVCDALASLERVVDTGLPLSGGGAYAYAGRVARRGGTLAVAGPAFLAQPVSRIVQYSFFWVVVLLAKLVFDLQVIVEQVRLVRTVQEFPLKYSELFTFSFLGYKHALIIIGSWLSVISLIAVNSYIAFVLAAPVVGWAACSADGMGQLPAGVDVRDAFVHGLRRLGGKRARPLAQQFTALCVPLAAGTNGGPGEAAAEGVAGGDGDAHDIFRRAWDQFVMALREDDLISNEEQLKLMYGDDVLGVSSALPLFMYSGVIKSFIARANKLPLLASTAVSDEDFIIAAAPNVHAREAMAEIAAAVPHILTLVIQSHAAFGFSDATVFTTISSLFLPAPGATLRETVIRLLGPPTVGGPGSRWATPRDLLREVAASVSRFVVAFERSDASTRLRGSPLISLASKLLLLLGDVWGVPPDIILAISNVPTLPAQERGAVGRAVLSYNTPSLEALAFAATVHHRETSTISAVPAATTAGADVSSSAFSGPVAVRSVRRLVAILQDPNDGGGLLDGGGDDPSTVERLEALRESARRVFFLLTMEYSRGTLAVAEAERRLTSFVNSLYMPQVPRISSVLRMPSTVVVTPHYNEAIIYSQDFLVTANASGVTPMVYLKSVHLLEFEHALERLGVTCETEAWSAGHDALGRPVSGELEMRIWASMRGQTLARTVRGIMQSARAIRLLATLQLEVEYAAIEAAKPEGAPRLNQQEIEDDAANAAAWFTRERFSYVIAAQRYAEHGDEDVRRRVDLDHLLLVHPLLSVAYWDSSVSTLTGRRRTLACIRDGINGVTARVPCPGNPIVDSIGEGKPENSNVAQTFARGRILQAIDMNQSADFESTLLLPHALSMLLPRGQLGSDGVSASATFTAASRRPLVLLGLREHIFTSVLSSPALMIAEQEKLFGTMWQRLMASPFRVRLHYGHPDLCDRVWLSTRGGTAKASSTVNVSEDVFAGLQALLRGGESGHAEFICFGKGRDVGMLQILGFESKISGGTAISGTTRDNFRAAASVDFARLLSLYHTGIGFFISNVAITMSIMITLYYFGALSLSGADAAIKASNYVYLVGEINALQWVVQMGFLTVVPLFVLYTLEGGVLSALGKTLRLYAAFSPFFFMFEIQTKAYYFDAALTFGKQNYVGTGRDFVIRHVGFDECWRACAHSHTYLGGEALLMGTLIAAFGTFDSPTIFVYFFLTAFLFSASLLLAPLWFNPGAMDWSALSRDWSVWWLWLHSEAPVTNGADVSWRAWYARDAEGPYKEASRNARVWRILRVSRLLLFASLIAGKTLELKADGGVLALGVLFGVPWVIIAGLEIASRAGGMCTTRNRGTTTSSTKCPVRAPVRLILQAVVLLGAFGATLILLPAAGFFRLRGFMAIVGVLLTDTILLAWASRCCVILSITPLARGARTAWFILDVMLGSLLLAFQCLLSLLPLAAACHTRVLFAATYADTVAILSGSRDALNRFSRDAGVRFLALHQFEPLRQRGTRPPTRPEADDPINSIGVRRFRLKPISGNGISSPSPPRTAPPTTSNITTLPSVDESTTVPAPAAAAAIGLGGLAALGAIGEVAAVTTTTPPTTIIAVVPGAPRRESPPPAPRGGSSSTRQERRPLAELLKASRAISAAEARAAAPIPIPMPVRTLPSSSSSSSRGRGGGVGGGGGGQQRSTSPSGSGASGGSAKPSSGVSALRARFERH